MDNKLPASVKANPIKANVEASLAQSAATQSLRKADRLPVTSTLTNQEKLDAIAAENDEKISNVYYNIGALLRRTYDGVVGYFSGAPTKPVASDNPVAVRRREVRQSTKQEGKRSDSTASLDNSYTINSFNPLQNSSYADQSIYVTTSSADTAINFGDIIANNTGAGKELNPNDPLSLTVNIPQNFNNSKINIILPANMNNIAFFAVNGYGVGGETEIMALSRNIEDIASVNLDATGKPIPNSFVGFSGDIATSRNFAPIIYTIKNDILQASAYVDGVSVDLEVTNFMQLPVSFPVQDLITTDSITVEFGDNYNVLGLANVAGPGGRATHVYLSNKLSKEKASAVFNQYGGYPDFDYGTNPPQNLSGNFSDPNGAFNLVINDDGSVTQTIYPEEFIGRVLNNGESVGSFGTLASGQVFKPQNNYEEYVAYIPQNVQNATLDLSAISSAANEKVFAIVAENEAAVLPNIILPQLVAPLHIVSGQYDGKNVVEVISANNISGYFYNIDLQAVQAILAGQSTTQSTSQMTTQSVTQPTTQQISTSTETSATTSSANKSSQGDNRATVIGASLGGVAALGALGAGMKWLRSRYNRRRVAAEGNMHFDNVVFGANREETNIDSAIARRDNFAASSSPSHNLQPTSATQSGLQENTNATSNSNTH